jgi:uncharacterized protein YijF (DUF1287 family)
MMVKNFTLNYYICLKNILLMLRIILLLLAIPFFIGCSYSIPGEAKQSFKNDSNLNSPPLVRSARDQIGVVTRYDTSYYQGGYPPEDRGACTDVIERALRVNGYNLKEKIDADMRKNPDRYPHESDPNINFRRVRNVKIFLDNYAMSLPVDLDEQKLDQWQAGDIVTYDQIPGSLWHIAIISDKINNDGFPLLIHNYSTGVVEDDLLIRWPAPITGHYRLDL